MHHSQFSVRFSPLTPYMYRLISSRRVVLIDEGLFNLSISRDYNELESQVQGLNPQTIPDFYPEAVSDTEAGVSAARVLPPPGCPKRCCNSRQTSCG